LIKSVVPWLVENAGLISVTGALIIFFSWTVTNALGQQYSRLKQSVETAESTFRLYTTLHELRDSLNSVAMETVYAREAAELDSQGSLDRPPSEVADLRREYSHTRMSAHQIRELMDFAAQTLDFSSGVGTNTATAQEVQRVHDYIYRIYAHVRDLDHEAELVNASPAPNVSALRETVGRYVQYVRQEAIPLLYVVGSLLALGGQYLDKVYKKELGLSQAPLPTAAGSASTSPR
jgi:hypothetical protein